MIGVDPRIYHTHSNAVSLAVSLCLVHFQIAKAPLLAAYRVSAKGWASSRDSQRDPEGRDANEDRDPAPYARAHHASTHRSIPMTFGPGSKYSGSGAASNTDGPPVGGTHGSSGSER